MANQDAFSILLHVSIAFDHLNGNGHTMYSTWYFISMLQRFLCRLRSIATHRDHFVRRLSVRLSVCPSVTLPKLCFAGDTCIPRDAATIFIVTYAFFGHMAGKCMRLIVA